MRPRTSLRIALLLALGLSLPIVASGTTLGDEGRIELFGDFRLRLEQDWDSARADGSDRDDRMRARARARIGLNWQATETVTFGARLRSGNELSQQSPHVTLVDFDDNDTGPADFTIDKWFVKAAAGTRWAWAGRNAFPFWKQNEMFWDDDVTPIGLAFGWKGSAGESGTVALNLGHFTLPVGMTAFSGNLTGAQLVYANDADRVDTTVAAGLYSFDADKGDPDALSLRSGNGLRDYTIWVVSGQARLTISDRPLTFGIDAMHNSESYATADPYAFLHRDATDGLVLSARWGSTSSRGDWLLGYWYGEIEALAVNASYAQDDWVRWGSAAQTDSSDLRGHELRFAYGLGEAGNLVARLYIVEAISSRQDGNRLRIDWNISF